jgi:gluconolactonase
MTDVQILADGLASPEGPDVLPDGRIVFVETFHCRVSVWDPDRGLQTYADVGGAPNACMLGTDGVYVAQNGVTAGPWRSPRRNTPSIQRIGDDGRVEVVVDSASGAPLVGPNDLTFGPDGRLYFTDPGVFDTEKPDDGRICVVQPDGAATILEEVGPTFPNGIVAEADGSIVWDESYTRRVRRRRPDGSTELLATLPEDRILDGMKVAQDGNLYIAGVSSGGIDVLTPDGELVDFIETGGAPLNCVFDGEDLYVADFGEWSPEAEQGKVAGGRLLRVPVGVSGQPLFRGGVAVATRSSATEGGAR